MGGFFSDIGVYFLQFCPFLLLLGFMESSIDILLNLWYLGFEEWEKRTV